MSRLKIDKGSGWGSTTHHRIYIKATNSSKETAIRPSDVRVALNDPKHVLYCMTTPGNDELDMSDVNLQWQHTCEKAGGHVRVPIRQVLRRLHARKKKIE